MTQKSRGPIRRVVAGAVTALLATSAIAMVHGSAAAVGAQEGQTRPVVKAQWSVQPAVDAAVRLLGQQRAARFEFVAEAPDAQGGDHFRISADHGRIAIGGTTPAVLLRGLGTYLAQHGMDISWNGDQLGPLAAFTPPTTTTYTDANVHNRFAFNDTDDGYTGAYRSWPEWQRQIDVLALKGINEAFMPVGTEAVYLETFEKFGYSEAELLKWIPQASHQPWWLLQNMSSFPSPVTKDLVDQRAALGAKVARRMRDLGITPVLPGYFGTVPPGFADRNPGAVTVPQGGWSGFTRPDWLDPTSSVYSAVAKAFYDSSQRLLGASTMYKMDLLHEGGTAGSVDVPAASKAVQDALETAHPGAIWAILGWQSNPRQDTLSGIDKSKMFIVDGLSDRYDNLDRETSWHGTKYAFGSIWNFGGHTTMGANIGVWNQRYWQWKDKAGSALDGIAVLPEGSDNNPVALDFLTSLAWSDGPVDLSQWYADWAARRYGAADPSAQSAWQTIGATAYDLPSGTWSEAQDGLFEAEPSLTTTNAAAWSPGFMRYDATKFAAALPQLIDVPAALRSSSAYQYDLMDVTRQVLANTSRDLLPLIKAAYDAKDRATFDRLTGQWLDEMRLLDKVAGTNAQTMLGSWEKDIRAWGGTQQEVADHLYDARTLITVWGDRSGYDNGLRDYANREWEGLISTYYLPRWQKYFAELDSALAENRAPKAIDWYAYGDQWARDTSTSLPTTPSGDIHDIAQQVVDYLTSHPLPLQVSSSTTGGVFPGAPAPLTVTARNPNTLGALTDVSVDLTGPAGWTITPTSPTTTASLAPGGTMSTTWTVTPPADAAPGASSLTATTSYTVGGRKVTETHAVTVRVERSAHYVFSQAYDGPSYKRLTRTITVPTGGGSLSFWTDYATEQSWDYLFVEAHTPGQDDWTTLPDANGHTSTTPGDSCTNGWVSLHPQMTHYQTYGNGTCSPTGTTGSWNAATGSSGGWQQWSIDLSKWAGRTVEVSISYASDWGYNDAGVWLDDITLPDGTTSTFEDGGLDGWTVSGAPTGDPANPNDYTVVEAAKTPAP